MIQNRLSCIDIKSSSLNKDQSNSNHIPSCKELYSFLAKHETVFFNSNISSEEFNSLVATYIPHITICLNWSATVWHHSQPRETHGQHFVQLQSLYETIACPPQQRKLMSLDKSNTKAIKICDLKTLLQTESKNTNESFNDDLDEDEFWEENDNNVAKRCLLEDESFMLSIKA